MRDYFEFFQIDEDADIAAIETAYHEMLLKYPRTNIDDIFGEYAVEEGYKMLSNPETRELCVDCHRMSPASKEALSQAYDEYMELLPSKSARILKKAIK